MARYTLFVLKVPLNPHQPINLGQHGWFGASMSNCPGICCRRRWWSRQ